MAIFHARIQVIGRSAGRSVVAAAAYRAAQCLQDEKLERAHDYTAKTGVVHSEIMLPAGAPTRWSQGETVEEQHAARTTLWNEVDAGEKRCDAQLAREMEFAIPRELPRTEAIELARAFVREQFVDRGMVADLNVHWDVGADGQAKPHAHVMLTMRQVAPEGFGPKVREWNSAALYEGVRERWAALANERLAQLGHDVRIDHRSYAEQGIVLEPQHKIGPAGARRAMRGEPAERAAEHMEIARRNGEAILADPNVVLDAITRQHSTFTRADLARFVNRHTADGEQFARAMAVVEASPALVRLGADGRGRQRFTTREMLGVEQRMERAALALSQRTTHGVLLERRRAAPAAAGLEDEQRVAFGHLTRSRDLSVLVGIAGGGKTTLLRAARGAWEAEGYRVQGATLSGIAAEGLEAGSGMASRTLASLEWGWTEGRDQLTGRDVLVVDEAGMVGSRQMERVLARVQAAGAKLVLVGDPEQLQAIEAGAAFRAIAERVGAAEIRETRRQRPGWQREATRELATGRTAAALERYEAAGMVHGHETQEAARAALIAAWDAERQAAPERSRVILTATKADAAALNRLARERMRQSGALGAEQAVATERGERAFAAGDQLLFLRNERGLGATPGKRDGVAVKNGTLGTVLAVEGGGRLTVRLDGPGGPGQGAGRVVTFSAGAYAALEHGYATTTHKGQGVTAERAHVLASAHMDRHATYTALSRHRDGVSLHWSAEALGSRAEMVRALGRDGAKDTSLDYGPAPEAAGEPRLGLTDPAEAAAAYAERRGVVPAAEVAAGAGPAGPRLAARTALLLNRAGALQVDGAAVLDGHVERVRAAQAADTALPGLQPRFRRGRMLRRLEDVLAEAVEQAAQATAAAERIATAMAAELPALVRRVAERAAPAVEALKGWPGEALAALERAAAPTAAEAALRPGLLPALDGTSGCDSLGRPLLRPEHTPEELAERIAAAVADDDAVRWARNTLRGALNRAYRDPEAAGEVLNRLERKLGGAEQAQAALAGRPKALGPLQGRGGPFASEQNAVARHFALDSAPSVGPALVRQRQAERAVAQRLRGEAEDHRKAVAWQMERDRVGLPALSARAVRAVRVLLMAGAEPGWRDPPPWEPGPKPADVARAVRVGPVWTAVRRDGALRAELDGFMQAARERFPSDQAYGLAKARAQHGPAAGVPEGVALGACVKEVLRAAALLHRCRPEFEQYAVQQRQAEQVRLEEERRDAVRQAAERVRLEAEQARVAAEQARLRAARPEPRLGPSGPRPGM